MSGRSESVDDQSSPDREPIRRSEHGCKNADTMRDLTLVPPTPENAVHVGEAFDLGARD
jgi:hypothetical protein